MKSGGKGEVGWRRVMLAFLGLFGNGGTVCSIVATPGTGIVAVSIVNVLWARVGREDFLFFPCPPLPLPLPLPLALQLALQLAFPLALPLQLPLPLPLATGAVPVPYTILLSSSVKTKSLDFPPTPLDPPFPISPLLLVCK